jgi:hypothetical protein
MEGSEHVGVHIFYGEIHVFVTYLCKNLKSCDVSFIISTPASSFNHEVSIFRFSNLNSSCILLENVVFSMI